MKLSKLLEYNNIIIQCHDNPDADALACGFALSCFFKSKGKNAKFVYGGRNKIKKSNLLLMIKEIGIEIHYVEKQSEFSKLLKIDETEIPDLLITVDCQYGEGNVTRFKARKIAVIDHHQVIKHTRNSEIRPMQASCSTIIWDMLKNEGFDVNKNTRISTALYYGLMSDSGNFAEIENPLDRDMLDALKVNKNSIIKFKNTNISQDELKIAGLALLGYEYYKNHKYAIVRTEPCDPNILGVISDMLLEVDTVESCLVYNVIESGVKISVRSCTKEVKANELASFLAEGIGNGGGHLIKAGGFLERKILEKEGISFDPDSIHDFLRKRMESYFENTSIIYADKFAEDISEIKLYRKKELELGYAYGKDILAPGTKATIRTYLGDVDIKIKKDTVIMIGIAGEIYATTQKHFLEHNELLTGKYRYPVDYLPSVKDETKGITKSLLPFAHKCISNGNKILRAKKLETRVKVFTKWDKEKYYLGKPGDYLVFAQDDTKDIYIIDEKIFDESYELCK